jgi:hypothetical protein
MSEKGENYVLPQKEKEPVCVDRMHEFNRVLALYLVRKAMKEAGLKNRAMIGEIIGDAIKYFMDNDCSTREAVSVTLEGYGTGSRYKKDKNGGILKC